MSSKVQGWKTSSSSCERCCIQSTVCAFHSAASSHRFFDVILMIRCFLFSSRGAFVTGDNEGYVAAWDAQSRRRLFEVRSSHFWDFPHDGSHSACNV